MEKLYEGKAKILYPTDDPEVLLTQFKDDATAFNALKKGTIVGKGEINCTISTALFQWLESVGISTHFIAQPAPTQMLVRRVKIIPLEVVVRNIAAGSLCRQTGLVEGQILPFPLVEFYLKNDELGDPLLTSDRLLILDLSTPDQVEELKSLALKINQHLSNFFNSCQITLVDFKLEFGLDSQGKLLLADEISPDTCRLWDHTENDPREKVLDKDRFRRDLGQVEAAYQEVQQRVLEKIASEKP
ncbi:phosphoribosylaminoimidazolesuccinocarboxamide synthase [Aphanothece sacrum]|uniref:Phosphoribosylaminoimidazole-succinocarboxamide synthase n=1 Tax=Aphanothece sacrum FPU1 TaxID=1920663 RepID=A0A401IDH1_APHSA|nr:phosphoribosylaminoimidazolesuccinocarboxamide synthase [Aphanothece sacrum]GBF79230.1 phosphoribosylaminoimidazole-succinocarboxamide synthase [Aphanothece sacrum FPU1]GBF84167.1 phosphoribosylaminoimidazole-succinocarboxamide synthase PurC [Aphanothece sacrum FPU3]